MRGQQKIDIREEKVLKFTEHRNGYELVSNDGETKIALLHTMVMDGSMESSFYYTKIWILEDGGWIETDSSKSYKTKEEFISDISNSQDFTQAMRDYEEYSLTLKQQ